MKIHTAFVAALTIVAAVAATGCGHVMMMMHGKNIARPSATEFGTGPRASALRQFTATLQPDQPLRPRRMHTVRVAIIDAAGVAVNDATIRIDGGMPQHGHGLPTQPQVSRYLGDGAYLVEGMKFQMTGWWVVDFDIDAADRSDQVRFNLMLK